MLSPRLGVVVCVIATGAMFAGCAERRRYLLASRNERAPTYQQAPAAPQPSAPYAQPAPTQASAALAITTPPALPAMPNYPSAGVPSARGAAPAPTTDTAVVQASATAAARPEGPSLPAAAESPLRALEHRAAERYASTGSYIARLRRREEVNGRANPEELMLFRFRKQPWSVYFKWIGPEGQGREVVYVKGQYGDMIHTLLAPGDHPFMAGGKRMSVSPDNIFIRSRTRHSIRDAGIGSIIDRYAALIDGVEKGDKKLGTVVYAGRQKRPEYDTPMDCVERTIPAGAEPQLPRGGRRWLYFDTASRLPVLTITNDDRGHEVEYYCYDHIQANVRLDEDDFNPDKLWPNRR